LEVPDAPAALLAPDAPAEPFPAPAMLAAPAVAAGPFESSVDEHALIASRRQAPEGMSDARMSEPVCIVD
jgi:hypothetical protein